MWLNGRGAAAWRYREHCITSRAPREKVTIVTGVISRRRRGRVLIDFNFMQYSVTVVTYRATSSKFKPPYLRRMQGVKSPHQNSTSPVVDFYVLQFKDPLVRPRKFRDVRILCLKIQSVARRIRRGVRRRRRRKRCLRSGVKRPIDSPAGAPTRTWFYFGIQEKYASKVFPGIAIEWQQYLALLDGSFYFRLTR